ncbi:hypothetical protein CK203_045934 [Vitis vinifera]|uniref:Uncharacterized protein n=1 Tax=Vitis vinifera TaxID=29760 RepID=A0A438I529_VITVI|nr:hypothetical protein CK203_045934 [Vitis vinifera]
MDEVSMTFFVLDLGTAHLGRPGLDLKSGALGCVWEAGSPSSGLELSVVCLLDSLFSKEYSALAGEPERLARDLRIVDRDRPGFSSLDPDWRYHGITPGCYIGIGSKDRWAPGLAITGSREHYRFPGALPVLGSTPLDSTAPPPSPPPSGPTVQQDYTVPPPPPLPVQSAPRVGAFVLHGLSRGSSLCMFLMESWVGTDMMTCQVATLPIEFRMLDIERYTGIGCPRIHLQLALYGIEEGIARGLWADFSPSDLKGKNPGSGSRLSDDQHKPVAPYRSAGPTYLHPAPQPRLVEGGLIAPLPPRPPPHPAPPGFRTNLHCVYHQRASHDTEIGVMQRHTIQDLIDQGLVDLGRLTMTTDPLPTHDTRAILPPVGGVHLIEFSGYEIFMMGWDGEASQPISLYEDSDFSGYIHGQQVPKPFRLILDEIPRQTAVSPVYLQHVPPMTPFILSSGAVYPAGQRLRPECMSIGYCHCFGIFTIQFWAIYADRQSIRRDLEDSYGYSHYTCHDRGRSDIYTLSGIQQALGQMCLSFETIEPPEAMIVASPLSDRASVFSMCFPEEIPDYDLPMDLGDGSDGVILPDTYMDENGHDRHWLYP